MTDIHTILHIIMSASKATILLIIMLCTIIPLIWKRKPNKALIALLILCYAACV